MPNIVCTHSRQDIFYSQESCKGVGRKEGRIRIVNGMNTRVDSRRGLAQEGLRMKMATDNKFTGLERDNVTRHSPHMLAEMSQTRHFSWVTRRSDVHNRRNGCSFAFAIVNAQYRDTIVQLESTVVPPIGIPLDGRRKRLDSDVWCCHDGWWTSGRLVFVVVVCADGPLK